MLLEGGKRMIRMRDIFLSLLIEATAVGILFVFDHFHRVSWYDFIFYLSSIIPISTHADLSSFGAWLPYTLLALLFFANAAKWLFVQWLFRKGHKTVASALILVFTVPMFFSFWFSDLGF